MKKGARVQIEDLKFQSICDAAKFLDMSSAALNHALRKYNGKAMVSGMAVERLDDFRYKKGFEVLCENTGEVFKSVPEMLGNYGLSPSTSTHYYQRVMKDLANSKSAVLGKYRFTLLDKSKREDYERGKKINETKEMFAMEPEQILVQTETVVDEPANDSIQDLLKKPFEEHTAETVKTLNGLDALKSITLSLIDQGEYAVAKDVLNVMSGNEDKLAKISC